MNSRAELEKDYKVVGGLIKSPGKFESECIFVPFYWKLALEGGADSDDGTDFIFNIDASDVEMWPELQNAVRLRLWEDENGFVHSFVVWAKIPRR